MIALALSLGFFGSWHCLGMCGPIALGVNPIGYSWISKFISGLGYNIGRIISYTILGLLFGLFGTLIQFSGLQQWLSILAGIFLIILFIISVDLESYLYRFKSIQRFFETVQSRIKKFLQNGSSNQPLLLGILNGFLPCGMVYLALAGAILAGGMIESTLFMFAFGLGTIPSLFLLIIMKEYFVKTNLFKKIRSVVPYLQLFLGIYLIYRGIVVDFPETLNFSLGLKHPVLCH